MIYSFLSVIFIIAILIIVNWRKHLLLSMVIFYNVFIDFTVGFVAEGNYYGATRHAFNFLIVLYYLNKNFRESVKFHKPVFFFILYLFLMVTMASDKLIALMDAIPYITGIAIFPLALVALRDEKAVNSLEKTLKYLLFAYPIYIILSNIYVFGSSYSSSYSVGFLTTSNIYSVSVIITLGFSYLKSKELKNRSFLYLLVIINAAVLLINLRRTAILAVAIMLVINIILDKKKGYLILMFIALSAAYLGVNTFFSDVFSDQLYARSRILDVETYQEEGRYLEFIYLEEFVESNFNSTNMLFGYDFMNSRDFGSEYFGYPRSIHSDLLNLFYGGGIVCILLLIWLLVFLWRLIRKNYRIARINVNYTAMIVLLVLFIYFMIPGRLIGNFTTTVLIFIYMAYWMSKQSFLAIRS
jgi:hypothetical protein